ncbi:hypothetical protein A8C41_03450 [Ligilactobacillus salivarius]|uniref:restriction endonuclease subunit S n=2 Tax=Ligilactobacillus salivarius TaxID=1624 RepID=UPI000BAF9BDB|nr:restriction endonuclease subunit S [Ligilactobacillus salivarius]PAY59198.1 hypothetical protein A8C41_03450 [Ligilactobacillus salivarius]
MTKYKISEIGEVVGGGTPSTKYKEYYSTNKDISWITPKDLSGYTKMYISNGERYITSKGLNNSSAKMLPKDTILISSRAPIGYVAIAQKELATNQGFKSIIPDKTKILPEFLYFTMITKKSELENIATGSTFKEVSGKVMKNFEIDVPTIEKQKKIIDKLIPIVRKIELNNEINTNLSMQVHVLFQKLISSSKLKKINISELYDIKYGKTLPKSKLSTSGIKVYGANGLIGYTEQESVINKPTVTITSRGSGSGFVSYIDEKNIFLTNNLLYLIDKKNVGLSFTYELLKSCKPQQFVTGSAQPQLTIKNLSQLNINIPDDKKIMDKFIKDTISFEKIIQKNKEENVNLFNLKEILLNKYFNLLN